MATLWVRHAPSSAAVARRSVSAAFERAGLSAEQAFDAALIASELVGNAVRHGSPLPSGQLAVEWTLAADGYTISVTDGGSTGSEIVPREADSLDPSGRGLMIVAALSQDWGVASGDGRTTVWARGALSATQPSRSLHGVS
ncbi:MAG TPA: ATP-binding protein [Jatrophihabitans sp.]|nr:ATP-binding protein [Jatrophihabitans sp.]